MISFRTSLSLFALVIVFVAVPYAQSETLSSLAPDTLMCGESACAEGVILASWSDDNCSGEPSTLDNIDAQLGSCQATGSSTSTRKTCDGTWFSAMSWSASSSCGGYGIGYGTPVAYCTTTGSTSYAHFCSPAQYLATNLNDIVRTLNQTALENVPDYQTATACSSPGVCASASYSNYYSSADCSGTPSFSEGLGDDGVCYEGYSTNLNAVCGPDTIDVFQYRRGCNSTAFARTTYPNSRCVRNAEGTSFQAICPGAPVAPVEPPSGHANPLTASTIAAAMIAMLSLIIA